MFFNSGTAWMLGTSIGTLYGIRQGLVSTPSNRFRIQLNSILNSCSRHGGQLGNRFGVYAVLYSIYEGTADYWDFEEHIGVRSVSPFVANVFAPSLGAFM